jgi:hypothetical protein
MESEGQMGITVHISQLILLHEKGTTFFIGEAIEAL